MTCKRNPYINLYEPESVSTKVSELRNAANEAIEDCASEGVHPKWL